MIIRRFETALGRAFSLFIVLLSIGPADSLWGASVSGKVEVPEALGGIDGISVVAVDWFSFDGAEMDVDIDFDGQFSIELGASLWVIGIVSKQGVSGDWALPYVVLEIRGEESIGDLELKVLEGVHTVGGVVKDDKGQGIGGLSIGASLEREGVFYDVEARTGDLGRFTLKIPEGLWSFSVWGLPFEFEPVPTQVLDIASDADLIFEATRPEAEPLVIEVFKQPELFVGDSFTQRFRVSGGNGPFEFKLAEGSAPLPGALMLHPSEGKISGVPESPGEFTFEVVVRERFGVQTARQEITLIVKPDPVPPELESWVPRAFDLGVGSESAIRLQFSERMKPFDLEARPWFRWYAGRGENLTELNPDLIRVAWSLNEKEAFVSYRESLPPGRHVWVLNGNLFADDESGVGRWAPFQDRSGNAVASSGPVEFSVNPNVEAENSAFDPSLEVLLWRERYDDAEGSFSGDLEWTVGRIQWPSHRFNAIEFGRIVAPDQAIGVLEYPNRSEAHVLQFSEPTLFFTDTSVGGAKARYDFQFRVLGGEDKTLRLRLPNDQFPSFPVIKNTDELNHVAFGAPTEILLGDGDTSQVDAIEVIVATRSNLSPAIFLNPSVSSRYRVAFPSTERILTLPAGVLSRRGAAFGAVRFINYVDEDQTESGIIGRSAVMSSTEFRISTEDPQLIYPVAESGLRFRTVGQDSNTEWLVASDQQSIPVVAQLATESDHPQMIDLGRYGRIELGPSSLVTMDGTGGRIDHVLLELSSGRLIVHQGADTSNDRKFLVSTASAEVVIDGASAIVRYDDVEGTTNVEVLVGQVQARAVSENGFGRPQSVGIGGAVSLSPGQVTILEGIPKLTIEWEGNDSIRLSWPRQLAPWNLEELRDFNSARPWRVVSFPRGLSDWRESVVLGIRRGRGSGYRLARPEQ